MSKSMNAALPVSQGYHASLLNRSDDLDMTPMVDVTFLLLIFFMVTASFGLQRAIEMQRTPSELASPVPVPSMHCRSLNFAFMRRVILQSPRRIGRSMWLASNSWCRHCDVPLAIHPQAFSLMCRCTRKRSCNR